MKLTSASLLGVDTGIQLKLKPWVSGNITVGVEPSISGLPSTNEHSVVTTVRVKDGQTIVIGGLIQTLKHESVNKLPLLGELPILGHLFRSTDIVESETEFVIYITPHLILKTGFSGLDISEYGS
jgi:Flp pilus assembly secretin CpaC